MTDFDALLKRSFAEAPEPADDGFTVNVARAVARRERAAQSWSAFQLSAVTVACGALAYGVYAMMGAFGQDLMAMAGLEVARAHSAISSAPSIGSAAQGLMQSMSASMTQILLITMALGGGAVAYRVSQD